MKRALATALLLASSTACAQFSVPLRIKNSGTIVTPTRYFLNFAGAGVSCADDPPNAATTCTIPGAAGVVFPLLAPDGSAAAPSYSFSADHAMGMYRGGVNKLGFSDGVNAIAFDESSGTSTVHAGVNGLVVTADGAGVEMIGNAGAAPGVALVVAGNSTSNGVPGAGVTIQGGDATVGAAGGGSVAIYGGDSIGAAGTAGGVDIEASDGKNGTAATATITIGGTAVGAGQPGTKAIVIGHSTGAGTTTINGTFNVAAGMNVTLNNGAITFTGGSGAINNNTSGALTIANNAGSVIIGSSSHTVSVPRLYITGTALVAGDFAPGAGFGSTAGISAVLGHDGMGEFKVTAGGIGLAANATVVLTFHDGTWTTVPLCHAWTEAATGVTAALNTPLTDAETATTYTMTYNGVALTAGDTITISFLCEGT